MFTSCDCTDEVDLLLGKHKGSEHEVFSMTHKAPVLLTTGAASSMVSLGPLIDPNTRIKPMRPIGWSSWGPPVTSCQFLGGPKDDYPAARTALILIWESVGGPNMNTEVLKKTA